MLYRNDSTHEETLVEVRMTFEVIESVEWPDVPYVAQPNYATYPANGYGCSMTVRHATGLTRDAAIVLCEKLLAERGLITRNSLPDLRADDGEVLCAGVDPNRSVYDPTYPPWPIRTPVDYRETGGGHCTQFEDRRAPYTSGARMVRCSTRG